MKKNRIPYNELAPEIYTPKYWSKTKLFILGFFILLFSFIANFSVEDKITNLTLAFLAKNRECPIDFEKIQIKYLLPSINIKNPVVQGRCFNNPQNNLILNNLRLSFHSPSFYPLGIRLHVEANTDSSYINAYPVFSFFSKNIKIENTLIDSNLLALFMPNNVSPIAGHISVEGFLEFKSGNISDGELDILSKNLIVPAQNIQGFELPRLNLQNMQVNAVIDEPGVINIKTLQLGNKQAPLNLKLHGELKTIPENIKSSKIDLTGSLELSRYMLDTFAFLKLFLPANNTSGIYQMQLNGTLGNPGAPRFK